MTTKFVYPYRKGSKSVTSLAEGLGAKKIRLENSKFKGSRHNVVINWGNSKMKEEFKNCMVLNHPDAVKMATNKLEFFKCVDGAVSIPPYTTDRHVAAEWVEEGSLAVGRTLLTGHSGKGIILLESEEELHYNAKDIKLYTKYIPKKHEYRIHVFRGMGVVDEQRKALKNGASKPNWKVRNHENGFIYMREGIEVPDAVREEAVKALEATDLDFGAVDVIYNNYREKAYVLEINTAPGLEGQTLDTYIKKLDSMAEEVKALPEPQPVVYEIGEPYKFLEDFNDDDTPDMP